MEKKVLRERVKDVYLKYRHAFPLAIYMIIYLTWFAWLERQGDRNFNIIHVSLDDYIPFCELFVVPYFLWFAYVSVAVLFLFFKNKQDYYRSCTFLFTGMTLFLIISTLWPNGHQLRLTQMPRDNVFTQAVAALWKLDTPTNLWPSIHVYNSMGAHFAVMRSADLEGKKGIKIASGILSFSIILSTMFIKQHSVFDVATGIGLGIVMYILVYRKDIVLAARTQYEMKKRVSM
ncbi:MAG: serine/threonine protein phosphatase [Lachnospiraceae bacterium]|nr:serine/threonine protein phosphatase [Lachnospiraceae bacterium]